MKIILYLSNLLSVIFITLLTILLYMINGSNITTISLFLGLFVLLDVNISSLYKTSKKHINNPIYNILNIGICLYGIYILVVSYFRYFYYIKLNDLNSASLYFYDNILKVMIMFLILFVLSNLFKKEKTIIVKDDSKIIFIVLSTLFLLPILNFNLNILTIISLSLSLFYIILLFKINNINTKNDLQKLYFILIIISIFTNNYIGVVLLIHLYLNLDRVGLNI